ncbi:hypothetical protein HNQ07_002827 [Deinococcus metalli]|uniref:Uncharacterized protein n=1 Tax=Deinococcus metalli TaxID=1141878 RepID=A0A7W8KFP1_9DEIO|nr:hypothetical protein [Deinococcus metalli]MBB5377335.1 hypothetical protein [Deinococcus metalli]
MSAWWFQTREVWAVEIDDLEGLFRGGQQVTFTLEDETAGPFLIRSVEMSDHRLEGTSYVALTIQAARKRGLDRFIHGVVEATDPQTMT